MKRISWVLAGVMSLVLAVSCANAGIGIMPLQLNDESARSWFVYTLNPGDSYSDKVVLTNHADEANEVRLEALDAVSTTTGGYSLVESVDDNRDIGSWITLSTSTLKLKPHESREIAFTVNVPSEASVGEHNGGISAYEINTDASKQGMNIRTRIAARVYITIPGEIERSINIRNIDHAIRDGHLVFNIQARNDSNVKLEPGLDIFVSGLFGTRKQSVPTLGTFLAGSEMDLQHIWDGGVPTFGYYRVKCVFHTWPVDQVLISGAESQLPDETYEYTFSFWAGSPWVARLLLAILLLWIGYRVWIYLEDRARYLTDFRSHTVKKGETLFSLAEQAGLKPQRLVRLNRLVWPYVVAPKDKILLPQGRLSLDQAAKRGRMPSIWRYLISWQPSLYQPQVK